WMDTASTPQSLKDRTKGTSRLFASQDADTKNFLVHYGFVIRRGRLDHRRRFILPGKPIAGRNPPPTGCVHPEPVRVPFACPKKRYGMPRIELTALRLQPNWRSLRRRCCSGPTVLAGREIGERTAIVRRPPVDHPSGWRSTGK